MANREPLRREDHPELEDLWRLYDDTMSFVPNSLFTMARRPEILSAFSELITQIWRTGTVPVGLKPLVAVVASTAAGCRYCQAHETVDARMRGVDERKIAEIWDFERSPLYSDAERVALRFARDASVNRWNDSMATNLEDVPAAFANRTIGQHGWDAGKHR